MALAVAAIVAMAVAGCGQAAKTGGGLAPAGSTPATPTTTETTPATTAPPTTAGNGLARYFAAARLADARIHHAAKLINGEIGTAGAPSFSRATTEAVSAADPLPAAAAIPAGLRPNLMWAVLRVQNDLEARWYAFKPVAYGAARGPDARSYLMTCLAGGAPAAARFPADLRAARRLAASLPPIRLVAARSRAAANLAIRKKTIVLANSGCDSCGGYLFPHLPAVVWRPSTIAGSRFDGTVGHIPFRARYHPGSGWDVFLNAC